VLVPKAGIATGYCHVPYEAVLADEVVNLLAVARIAFNDFAYFTLAHSPGWHIPSQQL